MPKPLYEARSQGGIAVADRPMPRWLIGLCIAVIGWSIFYLITFGTQYAGRFPRSEQPAPPATSTH